MPAGSLIALTRRGCGFVVGTVGADGRPRATRAWAVDLVEAADGARLRVTMSADDETALANLRNGMIAVTGADIRTLQSVQVKGRVTAVEEATPDDVARMDAQAGRFFAAVLEVDGTPRELLDTMLPNAIVAVEMVVESAFDQSPGPQAGAPVDGAS